MPEHDLETLAAQFIELHRDGQRPAIEEYAIQHPKLADEIRELFPTMIALEKLKEKKQLATPPSRLPSGIKQLGDFRIIGEIGRGGMGIVYEAEQLSLGRRVAVKVLPQQSLLRPKQLERFQREAMLAARLHHTNIVPVFGVGHDDGYHYIVMQFIDGVGLDEIIYQLSCWSVDKNGGDDFAFELGENRTSQISESARSLLAGDFQNRPRKQLAAERSPKTRDNAAETVALIDPDTRESSTEHAQASEAPSEATSPATVRNETRANASSDKADVGSAPESSDSAATRRIKDRLGPAYWRSVARLGQQAASAIAYAHSQETMHRDLKPGNLLLDATGHLWVADFGLAKAVEQQQGISRTGDVVGTLAYMAPEQLSGKPEARSDIYSLGLTLYEMLTLQPAYDGRDGYSQMIRKVSEGKLASPRKLNPEAPNELETIVLKAIAREPNARYATAQDLADDLNRFLDDRPILATRASLTEHAWRWSRRNPLAAGLVGLVASLMFALAGVLAFAYASTNSALQEQIAEKQKTESTLEISLIVLDQIYERIAPDRVSANDWSVADDDGKALEIAATPSMSPVTEAILEDLIAAYEEFAKIDTDNRVLKIKAAKAQRRSGEIQFRLGKYEQARSTLHRAIEQYEALASDSDEEESYVVNIARIRNTLGEVLWRQQDPRGRDEYDAALKLLSAAEKPTADTDPELKSPDARLELARTLYYVGRRREHPTGIRPPSRHGAGGRRPNDGPPEWMGPGGRRGPFPPGQGNSPFRGPGRPGPQSAPPPNPNPPNDEPPPGPAIGMEFEKQPAASDQHADLFVALLSNSQPPPPKEPPPNSKPDPSKAERDDDGQTGQPPLSPNRSLRPARRGPEGRIPGGGRGLGGRRDSRGPGMRPGGLGQGGLGQGGPGQGGPGGPGQGGIPGRGGMGGGRRFGRPDMGGGPMPWGPRFDTLDRQRNSPFGAENYLKRAVAILEALAKEQPGSPEVTRLRALCHRELATDPFSPDLVTAIELFEGLHRAHPNVADYANDLSRTYITHLYLHDRRRSPVQHKLVTDRLDKAHTILVSLTSKHPAVVEYASELSLVLLERAQSVYENPAAGRPNERLIQQAHDDLARAVELQTQVVNKNKKSSIHHAGLAVMEYRYAESLYRFKQFPDAALVLEASIARLEASGKAHLFRHSMENKRALATTYEVMGQKEKAEQLRDQLRSLLESR